VDVVAALKACLRRFYVFLPILALGVYGGVHEASTAKPTYQSTLQILALPTATYKQPDLKAGLTQHVNPFNLAGNPLVTAAASVTATLNSSTVQREVYQASGGGYSATLDTRNPLVNVTASAATLSRTRAVLQAVVTTAQSRFRQLQIDAGSPPEQLLQLITLTGPDEGAVTASYPGRSKTVVGFVLGGLVAAMLAATTLDALLARRRRRRTGDPRVATFDAEPPVHTNGARPVEQPVLAGLVSEPPRVTAEPPGSKQPDHPAAPWHGAPSSGVEGGGAPTTPAYPSTSEAPRPEAPPARASDQGGVDTSPWAAEGGSDAVPPA
jgi:hypothetical protein